MQETDIYEKLESFCEGGQDWVSQLSTSDAWYTAIGRQQQLIQQP